MVKGKVKPNKPCKNLRIREQNKTTQTIKKIRNHTKQNRTTQIKRNSETVKLNHTNRAKLRNCKKPRTTQAIQNVEAK